MLTPKVFPRFDPCKLRQHKIRFGLVTPELSLYLLVVYKVLSTLESIAAVGSGPIAGL